MSPHASHLADVLTWIGTGGFLSLMAFFIARSVRNQRRRPRYPDVQARYEAERQAQRERENAAWKRVWAAVTSDDEPVPPEWDEFVTGHPWTPQNPRTPQQGDEHG